MDPQVYDSHSFLAVGFACAIVLSLAAFGIGVYNAWQHSRIKDQIEQVLDAWTPSMAEAMPEEAPSAKTGPIPVAEPPRKKTEWRQIGGRWFEFDTGEQVVAEREVAVREAGRDARQDVQGLQGRGSTAYSPRPAPRPPLPHLPQRREAE